MRRKIRVTKDNLLERIQGYLRRAEHDEDVPVYPLLEKGIFRIIGGVNDEGSASGLLAGNRYPIKEDMVRGRFVDAIAYALQQRGFYGWYCSGDDMENSNHGLVIRVDPKQLPRNKTLDSLVLADTRAA